SCCPFYRCLRSCSVSNPSDSGKTTSLHQVFVDIHTAVCINDRVGSEIYWLAAGICHQTTELSDCAGRLPSTYPLCAEQCHASLQTALHTIDHGGMRLIRHIHKPRQRGCSQDAEQQNHDHQLDDGKTLLVVTTFHLSFLGFDLKAVSCPPS